MRADTPLQHRLQVILAADAVGYSRLMAIDDAGTVAALDAARAVFARTAGVHGGQVIDTAGDSVLVTFPTATGAVRAAEAIQQALAATALRRQGAPLAFRIGIHLGDLIVKHDGTVYGEGVNVAARLQAIAESGGVLVSDAVRGAVRPEIACRLVDAGRHEMKNIARPVHAFRLAEATEPAAAAPPADATRAFDVAAAIHGFDGRPAIAVLPFENMSNDPDQAYFADGIAEDILTRLAMWRWMPVIARNSSFVYRGRNVDVKQVGKELGARYVLEGSVRRSGQRVRVTGQLIDADSGHHVWAQRYDRVLDDIFVLQDAIVEEVVGALEPAVGAAERGRAARVRPHDLDAWELFQKAAWRYAQLTHEGFIEAYTYAAQAAQQDPGFASPLAYAAMAKLFSAMFGWEETTQALKESHAFATEALRRDPLDPLSLAAHASTSAMAGHHDLALAHARASVELNPSFALGHHCLGWILMNQGQAREAIQQLQTALRLSPNDAWRPLMLSVLSTAHFMEGEFAQARQIATMGMQEAPHYPMSYRSLASACGALGLLDEGREAMAALLKISPNYSMRLARQTMPFRSDEDFQRYMGGLRALGWQG